MITEKQLDKEWLRLIIRAKRMGLSPDELRTYFKQASTSNPRIVSKVKG